MSRTLTFLVILIAALAPFGVERLVAQDATEDATHETAPQAAPGALSPAPSTPPASNGRVTPNGGTRQFALSSLW